MLFNTSSFLLFFPGVTLAYFWLPRKMRWGWLLVASYYFAFSLDPLCGLLLLGVTGLTYLSGLLLARFAPAPSAENNGKSARGRRLAVALSLTGCLGLLGFFKYFDFLANNLCAVLAGLGITAARPAFSPALPAGLSFYTFQALGYVLDVARGKTPAEKNLLRYALFVGFFPTLVAGPIQRSDFLEQLKKPANADYDRIRQGLMLMLWGYFQKLVIADRAAILVNAVFAGYGRYAGFTIAFAVLLFAVQLYCDFAGYSAIAMGAAQVLGFSLRPNFRQPYFAVSVSDFWRRWHISLSTWFRDELYIPLGGSRCSTARTYGNLLLTFLLSGLWHGASWNYVLWGGMNGAMLVAADCRNKAVRALCRRWGRPEPNREGQPFSARLLRSAGTFLLIGCTWVFFRAPSAKAGLAIFGQMFRAFNPWVFFDGTLAHLGLTATQLRWLAAAIAVLLGVDVLHEKGYRLREWLMRQQLWFRLLIYLLGIFGIAILGVYGPNAATGAFLYAQF